MNCNMTRAAFKNYEFLADITGLRETEEGGSVTARSGAFLKQWLTLAVEQILPGLHLGLAELVIVLDFVQ